MRGKEPMNRTITFRAGEDEIAAYQHAWQRLGYKSQSQFHRLASNALMLGKESKHSAVSPVIMLEINTHLNRVGSAILELIALAANDNQPLGEQFGRDLRKALQGVDTIRRKVS